MKKTLIVTAIISLFFTSAFAQTITGVSYEYTLGTTNTSYVDETVREYTYFEITSSYIKINNEYYLFTKGLVKKQMVEEAITYVGEIRGPQDPNIVYIVVLGRHYNSKIANYTVTLINPIGTGVVMFSFTDLTFN